MHGASSEGSSGQWRWAIASSVWLLYLIYPISQFIHRPETLAQDILAMVMLGTFVGLYVWAWIHPRLEPRWLLTGGVGLTALSVLAMWWLALPTALGGLVFVGPLLGFIRSWRVQITGAVVVLGIMVASWLVGHDSMSLLWSLGLPFLGLVVVMRIYADYWHLFHRLHQAEDAVRELAVVNERLRMARDLHDIVGHNLSVVALRAELAAQLAGDTAPEAAAEMLQVAQSAREALRDVRAVISRWRVVSFEEEWTNAQRVLASAGVKATAATEWDGLDLPPEVDRVFGFFVREGVTNILRHSRATECRLTLSRDAEALSVRLEDNGAATIEFRDEVGSGLAGLHERFGEIGGRLAAFRQATGYVLEATVPWGGIGGEPGATH